MYLCINIFIIFITITPLVISKVHLNKKNIDHQDNNIKNNDEEKNMININNNILSPLSSSSDNDYFNIKSLIDKNKLNEVGYQGDVNDDGGEGERIVNDDYDDNDVIIYKSSLQCSQFKVNNFNDEEENKKIVMDNFDIIYPNNNNNHNNNNHIDDSIKDKSAEMNLINDNSNKNKINNNKNNDNKNMINNNSKFGKETKRIRYMGNVSTTCKFRNSNSGCFAVWQNNTNNNRNNVKNNNNKNLKRPKSAGFLLKSERNCWDGQDGDDFNCINQDKCVAKSAGNGIYYCCCDKDMCNVEMILLQTVSQPISRESALLMHKKKSEQSALFHAVLYSLVPLSIVTSITILGFFVYRMCVSKEDNSPCTSTTLHSTKTTPLLPPPSPTLSLHTSSLATVTVAHPASLLTAEVLKKIELLEIKAERFFGCVRRGKLNDEIVAVKIFKAQEKKSWEAERDFYNQPFMLSNMRSRHVLKFITAFKHEKLLSNNNKNINNNNNNNDDNNDIGSFLPHYWLITEYHNLGSLYDFLKHRSKSSQPLTLPTALNLIKTMCLGLNFLHSRNHSHIGRVSTAIDRRNQKPLVAHRDIKSRNILVKEDLSCCVADFGLALVMDGRDLSNQSQVGTVRYMSPEWLACESEFKEKCFLSNDVYALGLVIWEVLSMVKEGDIEPTDRYRLPYEERVGSNPSIEEMHQLVTVKKSRPFLNPQWTQHKTLEVMRDKLEKMWDEDYEARISVSNVLNSLDKLTEDVEELKNNPNNNNINNNNSGTGCSFDNDSFIINSNNNILNHNNNILNPNNNILIHMDNNPDNNNSINKNNNINNNSLNTNNNNNPNNITNNNSNSNNITYNNNKHYNFNSPITDQVFGNNNNSFNNSYNNNSIINTNNINNNIINNNNKANVFINPKFSAITESNNNNNKNNNNKNNNTNNNSSNNNNDNTHNDDKKPTLTTTTTFITTTYLPSTSPTNGFFNVVGTDDNQTNTASVATAPTGASALFDAFVAPAVVIPAGKLATLNPVLSGFEIDSVASATQTTTTINAPATTRSSSSTQTTPLTINTLATITQTNIPLTTTNTVATTTTPATTTTTTPLTTTTPSTTIPATTTTTNSDLDHSIIAPSILTIDIDDDYLVPPFNLIKMATPLPPPISNTIENGGNGGCDGVANSCINNNNINNDEGGNSGDNGGEGRLERPLLNRNNDDNDNIKIVNNNNNKNNNSNNTNNVNNSNNSKNNNNATIFNFESCMNERQRLEIDHFQNKYNDNKNMLNNNNNSNNNNVIFMADGDNDNQ